jgi:hypothetical protein
MFKVENLNYKPELASPDAKLWAGHIILNSPGLKHPSSAQQQRIAHGVFEYRPLELKSFVFDTRHGDGIIGLGIIGLHVARNGRHKSANEFIERVIESSVAGMAKAGIQPVTSEYIAGYATSRDQLAFSWPSEVFDDESAFQAVIDRSYGVDNAQATEAFETLQELYAEVVGIRELAVLISDNS